jgi:23S rRNA (adenine-N6)-dimethyltransferase
MMRFRFPAGSAIVSNVPYHLTTPLLKKMLIETSWSHALLVLQWEVARKRAAVGGTTLLTVRWWPWYDFTLLRRIGARSFRPVPSVDSGLLQISRRSAALVPWRERREYQRLVERVFSARGSGVRAMTASVVGARTASVWAKRQGIPAQALPKRVDAEAWADLYREASSA